MIRIVIAEDQPMLLSALASLLNMEDDMEVVGMARDGKEAISLVHQYQPDVCIMDIDMPEKSGMEAAEELKGNGSKIIMLTTFARQGFVQRALMAEVNGYLLKDSPSSELASAIRRILAGEQIYAPELFDDAVNMEDHTIISKKTKLELVAATGNFNQRTKYICNYFLHLFDKVEGRNRKKAITYSNKKG
ncbi:response regulator [Lederbergia citrea]|uniref:response regulator n=1 Tax=Lederbergia citrea TaxID=2833581 RepID=UPI001BC95FEC|nr:response regulator [Lederbergia citrea]MBS4176840.1 response regulator [Lederbergia citrea]